MIGMWAVPVTGIDPTRVRLDHLHAVASGWMDDNHWDTIKPWAITPLSQIDQVTTIGVITLTENAGTTLATAVSAGTPLRLGAQHGHALSDPVLRQVTRPELLLETSHVAPTRASVWNFLTPATFRNRNRTTPLPDPQRVVHSLSAKWQGLYPSLGDELRMEPRQVADISVTDIDGHNEVFPIGAMTVSGFVGRVRYAAGDRVDAGRFAALCEFAELAGVGSYTTRGLGRIRREDTWQPGR